MAARSAYSFSFADFSMRVIFSVALVFLTYNPTQFSYVSWPVRASCSSDCG